MRRVAVIGVSCSGKTTLAGLLAERLDLPHIELDALHHGPNWTEASAEELKAAVLGAIQGCPDGWVVDGNYHGKIGDLVVERADTVIWLDPSLLLIVSRLARRTVGRIVKCTELWNGNRETIRNTVFSRDSLLAYAVKSHGRHRRNQPERLARLDARLVRLRTPTEVKNWLGTLPEPDAPAAS
jgi:adenylate kinase family enzyme